MARTRNRFNGIGASLSDSETIAENYNVALYARLSEDHAVKPSESIENQLEIMKRFIASRPELGAYREYVDRAYTGTEFKRPGFQLMMEDIRNGRINCVIVKDVSRLGRNLVETSNLVEVFFPFMNVRFISINDHFDTDAEYNDNKSLEIYLKNLVNDLYAKDVSKRISTVKEKDMELGKFMGGNAPYGYKVDPEHPLRQLVIDPPAAEVVRDIYSMVMEGISLREISRELQRRNLTIPGIYAKNNHLYQEEGDEKYLWRVGTISAMLKNQAYIGNVVSGKRRSRLCDGEKLHFTSEEEWIVMKGMHEPIVSEEIFNRARESLDKKVSEGKFGKLRTDEYPIAPDKYSKLLFCGKCGQLMRYSSAVQSRGRKYFYYCDDDYRMGKSRCDTRITLDVLDKAVAASISAAYKAEVRNSGESDIRNLYRSTLNREEHKYQLRRKRMTDKKEAFLSRQSCEYEKYVRGDITRNEFQVRCSQYDKSCEEIEAEIRILDVAFAELKSAVKARMRWATFLSDGSREENLSADLIRILVKRIDVYSNHKIHITYAFERPGGER